MIDAFWLKSPQGLVIDDEVSDSTKASLLQEQVLDFEDKYGERLGQRTLNTALLQARNEDNGELAGLVAVEVTLLDKKIGDTISSSKSENLVKTTVASLGPKERRAYKNAPVEQVCEELMSPDLEAVAVLSNLVVSPSARRLGIAKQLCDAVESLAAKEWQYKTLWLRVESENQAARTLYEDKLGFSQQYALPDATGLRIQDGSFASVSAETLVMSKTIAAA